MLWIVYGLPCCCAWAVDPAGIFLALLLRYDAHRNGIDFATHRHTHAAYNKTIFNATMLGYVIGLLVTLVIMIKFKHGQVCAALGQQRRLNRTPWLDVVCYRRRCTLNRSPWLDVVCDGPVKHA